MNKIVPLGMIFLFLLLTGCPHNSYEVTLAPRGDTIERKVVFYRSDGTDSSGAPKYQQFNSDELASIAASYPGDCLTSDGNRHTVKGEFTHALPDDIGGAGWYRRFSTTMGDAVFYVERFRGNDDFAGNIERMFAADEQLADLVVGWSRAQFGSEPGFEKLDRFLDGDFRRDLRNMSFYDWIAESNTSGKSGGDYGIRFVQYLIERGYVRADDTPKLMMFEQLDDEASIKMLQRLIARKLGVAEDQPIPPHLEFMADPDALENSWNDYLIHTDFYRAKLQAWENSGAKGGETKKPDPDRVMEELLRDVIILVNKEEEDVLTVRLSLQSEPLKTNGKWDKTGKQVEWQSRLALKSETALQPVFIHAEWVAPHEDFQTVCLGGVLLAGEELQKYCLWRSGLDEKKAAEWEQFLASFKPGPDALEKLDNFLFTGEPEMTEANKGLERESDTGKQLIRQALSSNPQ